MPTNDKKKKKKKKNIYVKLNKIENGYLPPYFSDVFERGYHKTKANALAKNHADRSNSKIE